MDVPLSHLAWIKRNGSGNIPDTDIVILENPVPAASVLPEINHGNKTGVIFAICDDAHWIYVPQDATHKIAMITPHHTHMFMFGEMKSIDDIIEYHSGEGSDQPREDSARCIHICLIVASVIGLPATFLLYYMIDQIVD